jgi:hypothetical protein
MTKSHDPAETDGKGEPHISLKPVTDAARENTKLLGHLAAWVVKMFADEALPLQLKLLLIPLLFIIPVYGLVPVVMLVDLTYCLARGEQMHPSNYLIFLGSIVPLTIVILLTFGILSNRFENSRALAEQLQSVTDARRPRQRARSRR